MTKKGPRRRPLRDYLASESRPFWKRPACDFSARQRLEPLGDLLEPFFARGLGEPRVHLGVLVGLAGDRRLEVLARVADRLAGRRVADLLQVLEVAVRMSGLALGGVTKQAGDV